MTNPDTLITSAIDAVEQSLPVDVFGVPMSGRSRVIANIAAHFRASGWEVLEVSGTMPPPLLPSFDTDRAVIAVDDWDLLDSESQALLLSSDGTLITSRATGTPAREGMRHLVIPVLSGPQLRTALTRILGFVLDGRDADSLAQASGGAIGLAARMAASAQASGALEVEGGRARLLTTWEEHADIAASHLVER